MASDPSGSREPAAAVASAAALGKLRWKAGGTAAPIPIVGLYGKSPVKPANARSRIMAAQASDAARHWRGGLWFEDFEPGMVIRHRLTRTVTQMDNMLFSNMTMNPQALHVDAHFCATETEWGRPLMNSLFTLGLMIGISVNDTTNGTLVANLGMTEVRFPAPLFEGDTVSCTTEILGRRESKSRPADGIVEMLHRAYKQDGTLVAECRRQSLMRKRPAA
jgi:acyl dehydratase